MRLGSETLIKPQRISLAPRLITNFAIFRYHGIPVADSKRSLAMNVSLTPELETLIHNKVSNGRYTSASEVVREALRLMEERDEVQELYKASMREKIAAGVASLRAGQGSDGEAFMAKLDADLAAIERREP
jgi:antitoxin ParD1/3/4